MTKMTVVAALHVRSPSALQCSERHLGRDPGDLNCDTQSTPLTSIVVQALIDRQLSL